MSEERDDNIWYLKGFRRAPAASASWNLFKTGLHTTLFWGLFLFLIPWGIAQAEAQQLGALFRFPHQQIVAMVGFVLAGGLGLWSGATMAVIGQGTPLPLDHPNALVVVGPYRYVRNPMAIAGLSQGIFSGIYLGSWVTILYVIAGGFIWNALARPPEEHQLERDFGAPYLAYKQAVRCWIPRLTPYSPPQAP